MLRTTLSKIKKAWAIALAARGKGDSRTFPSKFHKLSIAVLKTDLPPDLEKDKSEQCESCNQLLEYIFGPAKTGDCIQEAKSDVSILTYYSHYKNTDKEDACAKATTSTQTQEELTQKVEVIDETSLVEAEKKNIDDLNAAPKVLRHVAEIAIVDENNRLVYGNVQKPVDDDKEVNIDMRDKIDALVRKIEAAQLKKLGVALTRDEERSPVIEYSTDDSAQNRKQGGTDEHEQSSFDAIAKRCLDSPTGRIDEHLLKEMKKYGVPQGTSDSSMIQVGVIKKRKPVEKAEFEIESRKSDDPSAYKEPNTPLGQNLSPHYSIVDAKANTTERAELLRSDGNIKMVDASKKQKEQSKEFIDNDPRPVFDPHLPIIDPYDKKTLAYEIDEVEYPIPMYFESNEEKIAREPINKNQETRNRLHMATLYNAGDSEPSQDKSYETVYHGQKQVFEQNHFDEFREELSRELKSEKSKEDSGLYDSKKIIPDERTETNKGTQAQPLTESEQNDISYWQNQSEHSPYFGQGYNPAYGHFQQNMYWPHGENQRMQYYLQQKFYNPENLSAVSESKELKPTPEERDQDKNTANSNTATNAPLKELDPIKSPFPALKEVPKQEITLTQQADTATASTKLDQNNISPLTAADIHSTQEVRQNLEVTFVNDDHDTKANTETSDTTPAERKSELNVASPKKSVDLTTEAKPIENLNAKAAEVQIEDSSPASKKEHGTLEQAVTASSICSLPKLKEEPDPSVTSKGVAQATSKVSPLTEPIVGPAEEKPSAPSLEELPKLCPEGKAVPLSEMLKRVRKRSRIEQSGRELSDPVQGKCGRKKSTCPPPAPKCVPCSPPCIKPPPPPCPRPCKDTCPCPTVNPTCPPPKPTCPKPCHKFSPVFMAIALRSVNVITLLLGANTGSSRTSNLCTYYSLIHPEQAEENVADVITHSKVFGTFVRGYEIFDEIAFAREFDPWVPIPCWPLPKKQDKKKLVCPKEGCRLHPRPSHESPCEKSGNPCLGFPKRRNFSLTELLSHVKVSS